MKWTKLISFLTIVLLLFAVSYCEETDDISPKETDTEKADYAQPKKSLVRHDKKTNKIASGFQKSLRNIAKEAGPAVVNIRGEKKSPQKGLFNPFRFFKDKDKDKSQKPKNPKSQTIGSGFIFNKEGYIITNNHVIAATSNITVVLSDESEFEVKVIGKDPTSDLAVLKIESKKILPVIPLGDSSSIQPGDFAIAIGNPFGLSGTVTFGVISAVGRSERGIDRNAAFKNFIQTDAPINQGNSGGPLLNIHGQVIGVNTAIFSTGLSRGSVGIGFAIPINIAKKIVTQLIDKGMVERGYVGIQIKDLGKAMAKYHGLENNHGVLVNSVQANGPADKAGIKAGDIILEVNDKKVKNSNQLVRRVSAVPPKGKAKLTILRNKEKITMVIIVAKRPDQIAWSGSNSPQKTPFPSQSSDTKEWLGVTFKMTRNPQNKSKMVVAVADIKSDSPATKSTPPLEKGDVIESINYFNIENLASITQVIKQSQNKKLHRFSVLRKGMRQFIVVEIK